MSRGVGIHVYYVPWLNTGNQLNLTTLNRLWGDGAYGLEESGTVEGRPSREGRYEAAGRDIAGAVMVRGSWTVMKRRRLVAQ